MSKIFAFSAHRKDALHRTTTAVTIVNAGYKENVIPNEAKATVNHRIHPADNVMKVMETNDEIGRYTKKTFKYF